MSRPFSAKGERQRLGLSRDDLDARRGVRLPAQALEPRREASRDLARHADPQDRVRRLAPCGLVEHFVVQPDQPPAEFEADGADGGELEARRLLEQRRPDQLLEPLHLQADRRLRPPQVLGRAREAARLDDSDESPDDVDRNAGHGAGARRPLPATEARLIQGFAALHKRFQCNYWGKRIPASREDPQPMSDRRPRSTFSSLAQMKVSATSV